MSAKLKQDLQVLSYNAHDLNQAIQEFAQENPFVNLRYDRKKLQNLDWIQDKEGENLIDHLLSQVRLSKWSKKDKKVVTYLIYQLDHDGYLRTSLEAFRNKVEFTLEDLKIGQKKLQELDPLGIGARDLNECLLIQAKNEADFDQVAISLLEKESWKD